MDIGTSTYITVDLSILDRSKNYRGKYSVIVENGANLLITHTDTLCLVPNIHSLDVLFIFHLNEIFISIRKLMFDFSLYITFINNLLVVQNCQTRRVVMTGKRDGGLYVMECDNSSFIYVLKNKFLCDSYDV